MVRTMRRGLERRIGQEVDITSILGHWMVKHGARCYIHFNKDGDGKTPFLFRVAGADCVHHMHEFGEVGMAHDAVNTGSTT